MEVLCKKLRRTGIVRGKRRELANQGAEWSPWTIPRQGERVETLGRESILRVVLTLRVSAFVTRKVTTPFSDPFQDPDDWPTFAPFKASTRPVIPHVLPAPPEVGNRSTPHSEECPLDLPASLPARYETWKTFNRFVRFNQPTINGPEIHLQEKNRDFGKELIPTNHPKRSIVRMTLSSREFTEEFCAETLIATKETPLLTFFRVIWEKFEKKLEPSASSLIVSGARLKYDYMPLAGVFQDDQRCRAPI